MYMRGLKATDAGPLDVTQFETVQNGYDVVGNSYSGAVAASQSAIQNMPTAFGSVSLLLKKPVLGQITVGELLLIAAVTYVLTRKGK